ncbi:MAG TPA: hypothetical protein P5210_14110, partial [Draconibacterium sp.]|nr:hypothetical protein [Draconibacterium sp.]
HRSAEADERDGYKPAFTIWGRVADICKTFGWTWEYVLNEIAWIDIQMMLSDMPYTDYKSENTIDPVDGKKVKKGLGFGSFMSKMKKLKGK